MTATIHDIEKARRINTLMDSLGETLNHHPEAITRTLSFLNGGLPTMEKKEDKTAKERHARWREKKKNEGRHRLTAWVSREAVEALATLRKQTGQTVDQAVNDILIKAGTG